MANIIAPIIAAVIGSEALVRLIIFFVERRDGKNGLKNQLIKLEKDSCRTQMLVMMSDYTFEKNEIMRLAEHYFKTLKGDWYLTDLFKKWLRENGVEEPAWLNNVD